MVFNITAVSVCDSHQAPQRVIEITTNRYIDPMSIKILGPSADVEAENQCNTNSYTCFLGSNFLIFNYKNRTAEIYTHNQSYGTLNNIIVVAGVIAYNYTITGVTYNVLLNYTFYYGTNIDHIIINPNQFRQYGLN